MLEINDQSINQHAPEVTDLIYPMKIDFIDFN